MSYIREEEEKMKKGLNYSKESHRKKERQRVLDNFYTKKMKNGKTIRADYLDKVSLMIVLLLVIVFVFNKVIQNFFISIIVGIISIITIIRYSKGRFIKKKEEKIEEIKKEYKIKLEEEKVVSEDEDIEDYIIARYYEKKSELKTNMNFLSKDKIFKLYLLSIIFFIGSYFASYKIYYKVMSVITFLVASFIGSYNLTEYMRKRNDIDLLNKDIDV
jgi:cation transport ATPase